MSLQLDSKERWEMLADNDIMRIATRDPDGHPHVVPVWYVADSQRGCIYFATPDGSRKTRNLREEPRVSATVDKGGREYFGLRAIIIEGEASGVDSDEEVQEAKTMWAQKYFEQPEVPAFMQHFFNGELLWYRIDPTNWTSWDNSKIDKDKFV